MKHLIALMLFMLMIPAEGGSRYSTYRQCQQSTRGDSGEVYNCVRSRAREARSELNYPSQRTLDRELGECDFRAATSRSFNVAQCIGDKTDQALANRISSDNDTGRYPPASAPSYRYTPR